MEDIVGKLEDQLDDFEQSEMAELLASAKAHLMVGLDAFRQQARDDISDLRARLAVVAHLRDAPENVKINCRQDVQEFAQNMADILANHNCVLGNDIALALRDMLVLKPQVNKAFMHAVELHLLMLEYAVGEFAWIVDGPVCSEIRRNLGELSENIVAAIAAKRDNVIAFPG
ncbi:MAG: hypothetical protein JKY32_10890 [Rhizobiales bacterium]|nr:hypothetical protein [Hyphomicrobiales bacterium]